MGQHLKRDYEMTAITTPNTGIKTGYLPLETAWGGDMNRNLRILDVLVQARVLDQDLTAPPGSPASGDAYIVASGATGDWTGQVGKIAIWCVGDDIAGEWVLVEPRAGWRVYVVDESAYYQYAGTWSLDSSAGPTKHREAFGDGAAGSFNITHSLDTRDVHVTVYRNSTPWESIACTVSRPDVDTVTLAGFASTPALDQFVVVVSK